MQTVTLSFPDSTYSESNPPAAATMKTDFASLETAVNANAASMVETTDSDVSDNSWVLDEDDMASDSAVKVPTQQSIKAYVDAAITATKAALYPIGSVYVNYSDDTNPGTLLGFGTWSAMEGETLVGKATSGTFASIASVGAETKTIAASNLPQLAVTITDPGHTHQIIGNDDGGTGGTRIDAQTSGNQDTSGSATTGITATANTGGANTAISLVQPSRVVYMWRRTA